MLALSSMRGRSTSFSLASDLGERVPDRRDQRIELLLALAQIGRGLLVHVADLLIGQLQEFIGAGFERGCGERLERVAQLILLGGAAPGGEQPARGEPATSATTTVRQFPTIAV